MRGALQWVSVALNMLRIPVAKTSGDSGQQRTRVPHWQNYGFAADAVEGEGLQIELGGFTLLLACDRPDDRPALAPFEVKVWHKEGHYISLDAGGKITAKGTDIEALASGAVTAKANVVKVEASASATLKAPKVVIDAPSTEFTGAGTFAGQVSAAGFSGPAGAPASATGGMNVTGTIAATVDVTAAGKSLKTHIHGGVQGGARQRRRHCNHSGHSRLLK